MKINFPTKRLLTIAFVTAIFFAPKFAFAQAGSITFSAVGDFGNDRGVSSNFTKVLQGIKNSGSEFTLALGDFIYSDDLKQVKPWCDHVNNILGANYPFELIAGNHDMGDSNADILIETDVLRNCLPNRINNMVEGTKYTTSASKLPPVAYAVEYYFDYPDTTNPIVRVILISPGLFNWKYTKGTANYNFVKSSILDARNANRPNGPIPWVVLGMHKNCVTNGIKKCEYSEDLMNLFAGKDLGPNGTIGEPVDIVFEGHEHTYHRSKPLKVNNTTCISIPLLPSGSAGDGCINVINNDLTNFQKTQGNIYNIVGTGGVAIRSLSSSHANRANDKYYAAWMGSNISVPAGGNNSWGFTKVIATRNTINAEFVATTGKYRDTYNITSNGSTLPTSTPPNPTAQSATSTPTITPTKAASLTMSPTATPAQGIGTCQNIPSNATFVEASINLPTSGLYKAWSRIMSEDEFSNSYWLQVDSECFLVGDLASMTPNVWTWVDYMNGNPASIIKMNLTSGVHKVRYYKNESNTRLDNVLFTTNQSCIPIGPMGGDCSGVIPGGETDVSPSNTPTPTKTDSANPTPTKSVNSEKTPTPTKSNEKDSEAEIIADQDASVSKSKPKNNYGKEKTVTVDGGSNVKIAYIRFDISNLSNKKIKSAKLKLRITNGSKSAQKVKLVSDNNWSESEIDYNNRPNPKKDTIARLSNVSKGKWKEIDVKKELSKAEKYITFAITSTGSDEMSIGSREQSKEQYKPRLVIKYK